MEKIKKTIIIGGVAGGASCAARLRRLNEFDKTSVVTYPGERVLQNRQRNLEFGIPVQESVWERILQL